VISSDEEIQGDLRT